MWDAPNRGPAAAKCPPCGRLARLASWREHARASRAANSAIISAQKADYYTRNGDAIRQARSLYKKANPEKYREYVRQRKAAITAAFVAPVDDMEIYERDGGICQLCLKAVDATLKFPDPMSLSIDHVIPLAAGGTHEPGNVQLAHMGCNARKGVRVAS